MKDTFEHITRPAVYAMDAMMNDPTPVLDHGFVRVVDYMGDDAAICQAARVSYGAGTKTVQNDEGLIRYLMRHWHSTPFEMCEIKLHVKLPVFVARQWVRHRTANINEYSARYSILDREFYIPEADVMAKQSATNNQGRGEVLDALSAEEVKQYLREDATRAYDTYEMLIDEEEGYGLARELARMNLPANVYTQWYWKVDLHNLFHFLRLRADPHAQWEIRQYANAICEIVEAWCPVAYKAFEDYRLNAANFSAQEINLLKELATKSVVERLDEDDFKDFGLSKREAREFIQKLT
jgi:thymidylate synthase (FAD)